MAHAVQQCLDRIQLYHDQYGIKDSPYVFLKANSGTYGMGVIPIHSAEDVLALNRKARNKLDKGKSSVPVDDYLIQEGVNSVLNDEAISRELVVYQISNEVVGSFFRTNSEKSHQDNLNSKGMGFQRICDVTSSHQSPMIDRQYSYQQNCGVALDTNRFFAYEVLAKLSGIAAYEEVLSLESVAEGSISKV